MSCIRTSWRIIPSPNSAALPDNNLLAVSALSPTAAWAVGVSYSADDPNWESSRALIERWNGSAWHIVATVNTDHGGPSLAGIIAITPSDIWAVGSQSRGPAAVIGSGPLIMHWDGTTWNVVPSLYAPTGAWSATLTSVAAITAHDVWAVGGQGSVQVLDQRLSLPVVEHWDGATWQVVSTPPLTQGVPQGAQRGGYLNAVTRIPGTNQLWAVGGQQHATNPDSSEPLIERWDGSRWQVAPGPALPSNAMGGSWTGVAALSATDAWAVGNYTIKDLTDGHPLIGHWDGTSWQVVVASPDVYGALGSVAASSATDVRAAGGYAVGSGASSGNGRRVPLIEQWNGTAWHIVTTVPDLPGGASSLGLHIATDGAGNYWAVGSYLNAAKNEQTLTMHCP